MGVNLSLKKRSENLSTFQFKEFLSPTLYSKVREAQLGPATAGTLCQCLASIVNNNIACVLILQQDLSSISSEISEAFSIISNDFQNCTSMIEFLEKKILMQSSKK